MTDMHVDLFLVDATDVQVWWICGGLTPAVGAAIAPAASDEPMSMKLERVGESWSLIVPIQSLHQLHAALCCCNVTKNCRQLRFVKQVNVWGFVMRHES